MRFEHVQGELARDVTRQGSDFGVYDAFAHGVVHEGAAAGGAAAGWRREYTEVEEWDARRKDEDEEGSTVGGWRQE